MRPISLFTFNQWRGSPPSGQHLKDRVYLLTGYFAATLQRGQVGVWGFVIEGMFSHLVLHLSLWRASDFVDVFLRQVLPTFMCERVVSGAFALWWLCFTVLGHVLFCFCSPTRNVVFPLLSRQILCVGSFKLHTWCITRFLPVASRFLRGKYHFILTCVVWCKTLCSFPLCYPEVRSLSFLSAAP